MKNTLTDSTLCEEQTLLVVIKQSYPYMTHPAYIMYIRSDIPQIAITYIWQFNPCESPDSTVYTTFWFRFQQVIP